MCGLHEAYWQSIFQFNICALKLIVILWNVSNWRSCWNDIGTCESPFNPNAEESNLRENWRMINCTTAKTKR